jgi:hypothetical protein
MCAAAAARSRWHWNTSVQHNNSPQPVAAAATKQNRLHYFSLPDTRPDRHASHKFQAHSSVLCTFFVLLLLLLLLLLLTFFILSILSIRQRGQAQPSWVWVVTGGRGLLGKAEADGVGRSGVEGEFPPITLAYALVPPMMLKVTGYMFVSTLLIGTLLQSPVQQQQSA